MNVGQVEALNYKLNNSKRMFYEIDGITFYKATPESIWSRFVGFVHSLDFDRQYINSLKFISAIVLVVGGWHGMRIIIGY